MPRTWLSPKPSPARETFRIVMRGTGLYETTHPTLAGLTIQDGIRLWENPFLRSDFPGNDG